MLATLSSTDTSTLSTFRLLPDGTLSFPMPMGDESDRVWPTLLACLYWEHGGFLSPYCSPSSATYETLLPEMLEKIIPPYRPSPSLEVYMKMVDTWAKAFEEEVAPYVTEELDSLYDDAYFEALELQKKLP